jgi:hypothetical protein
MRRIILVFTVACLAVAPSVYPFNPWKKNPGTCYSQIEIINKSDRDWFLDLHAERGKIRDLANGSSDWVSDMNSRTISARDTSSFDLKTTKHHHNSWNDCVYGNMKIDLDILGDTSKGGDEAYHDPFHAQLYEKHKFYTNGFMCQSLKWHTVVYDFPNNRDDFLVTTIIQNDEDDPYFTLTGSTMRASKPGSIGNKCSNNKNNPSLYQWTILPPAQRLVVVKVKFANEAALDRFAPMAKQSVADIDPALIAKLGAINNSHETMSAMNRLQSVELDKADRALLFTFSMVCDQADAGCTMQL